MEKELKEIRAQLIESNISIVSKATKLNTNTLYKITRGREDVSLTTIKKLKVYFEIV
tara:strand:- start:57 stop:227 length:171 start_codon:yes stop_codon:yes gene_type:complete